MVKVLVIIPIIPTFTIIYKLKIFFFTIFLLLQSCGIYVQSDYDRDVDFSEYNTFAFYKPDIDKVKISDLDKTEVWNSFGFYRSKSSKFPVGTNNRFYLYKLRRTVEELG